MEIGSLPRSAIVVLAELVREGPLTPSELVKKSDLAARTVSYALKRLRGHKLCKRLPNLEDMRQPLYFVDKVRLDQLHLDPDRWIAERNVYFRIH